MYALSYKIETEYANKEMSEDMRKATPGSNAHYMAVYNTIKNRILNGEYDETYTFVESEIAEELGVSRTPVREAIKMLKSEHLLERIPQSGIHCRTLTKSDVRPVYEVAEGIEGMMAYTVAANAKRLDLSGLQSCVLRMEQSLADGNNDGWIAADRDFHRELMRLSRNTFAVEMMEQINSFIQIIRVRYTKASVGSKKRSTIQHREAYEAIANGDADYARSIVQFHWKSVRRQVTSEINK